MSKREHGLTVLPSSREDWAAHVGKWTGCKACTIHNYVHEYVFARGSAPCDVLFVGEAPGKTEDITGSPFIGRSGKLLDLWIENACEGFNLKWAITNLTLCRPTDKLGGSNRPPNHQEVKNCRPRLQEFIQLSKPSVIITIGRHAAVHLPEVGVPVRSIVHPAYILRLGWSPKKSHSEQPKEHADAMVKLSTIFHEAQEICNG